MHGMASTIPRARAIAAGRLFGLMLEGHWITVGTPEAIGAAEAVIGAFREAAA